MSPRGWALWKAKLAGALDSARRALVDVEQLDDKAPAENAEAAKLAEQAALLRGGIAKLGQLRAYLSSANPVARAHLASLWDRVPGDDPAKIRQVIVDELGAPPEQLFAKWDDRPFAAASLGQVHAAEDEHGVALAVKIQYPDVAAALTDDLKSKSLLRQMVGGDLGEKIDDAALQQLRAGLLDELDYRKEATNLLRFGAFWEGDAQITIPRVIATRSSQRVLTMTRLAGTPLSALVDDPDQAKRSRVARALFRFAFGSPLRGGLVNADPHPGNFLVLDAETAQLGCLDFGCVTEVEHGSKSAEQQLWLSLIIRDGEGLRHAAHRMGLVNDVAVFEGEAWREWEQLLGKPFLTRGEFELTPAMVRRWIEVTTELLRVGRATLPAPVLLLWRQRFGVLSVIASLRPRFDFRRTLAEIVDDHHHPTPLADRYR